MLIFWPQRLVLLATPKTASTSLEAALESMADVAVLRPPPLRHMTAPVFRSHLAPLLEQTAGSPFRVAALMREPTDWLGSWYRARLREIEDDDGPRPAGGGPECLASFAAFVEAYLSETPPPIADVGSQGAFLGHGEEAADLIFRYESFDAFTAFLEEELDCELILPRLNVSPARDLSLPHALFERLREERAEDYALYQSLR